MIILSAPKRALHRTVNAFSLLLAIVLVKMLSPAQAYSALLAIVKLVFDRGGPLALALLRQDKLKRDPRQLVLQRMLCAMARHGHVEPKLQVLNEALLQRTYRQYGGLILATAHFGLTLSILRVLENNGLRAITISAGGNHNGSGWHWGCRQAVQLIAPGPASLLQAHRFLKQGSCLVAYLDHAMEQQTVKPGATPALAISPNIFDFARASGRPVLFFAADLLGDTIVVEFVEPSILCPDTMAAAAAVSEEFRGFVEQRLGQPCVLRRPIPVVA